MSNEDMRYQNYQHPGYYHHLWMQPSHSQEVNNSDISFPGNDYFMRQPMWVNHPGHHMDRDRNNEEKYDSRISINNINFSK